MALYFQRVTIEIKTDEIIYEKKIKTYRYIVLNTVNPRYLRVWRLQTEQKIKVYLFHLPYI